MTITSQRSLDERSEVERELRDKVRLLTGVVENNMALIYAKDLDGRHLFYNGTFAAGSGLADRGVHAVRPPVR